MTFNNSYFMNSVYFIQASWSILFAEEFLCFILPPPNNSICSKLSHYLLKVFLQLIS